MALIAVSSIASPGLLAGFLGFVVAALAVVASAAFPAPSASHVQV